MSRAMLFANGLVPDLESVRRLLRPDDALFAADGGTHHLLALGLTPSAIIGDLDSLSEADQRRMTAKGARLVTYPADKNQTDLELALEHVLQQGFTEVTIVGALGGRLDQTLGNLALLSNRWRSPEQALDVRLDDGVEEVFFARGKFQVRGAAGDTVSLIPWGTPVTGILTEGLRWPLRSETLYPDKTRGISNELLGEAATVSFESGLLLVVHRRKHQA